MCFHSNQHPSSIEHPFISLYSKYQFFIFICFADMNSPVFPILDDIYCTFIAVMQRRLSLILFASFRGLHLKNTLPVTTFGLWEENAAANLLEIVNIQSNNLRGDKKNNTRHFFERLSVTLQRENGSMLLERSPLPAPNVDGEL